VLLDCFNCFGRFGVLVGVLSLMQLRIMENLQQKIFIRSSFEFAVRLPKIKVEEYYNTYPPELANRFFDTLMIQKEQLNC
jgi:hypothetical protein